MSSYAFFICIIKQLKDILICISGCSRYRQEGSIPSHPPQLELIHSVRIGSDNLFVGLYKLVRLQHSRSYNKNN